MTTSIDALMTSARHIPQVRKRAWQRVTFPHPDKQRMNWRAEGEEITGNFREWQLMNLDWRGATLRDCDFTEASLMNVDLRGATLVRVRFDGAFIMNADFTEATFEDVWGEDVTTHNLDGCGTIMVRSKPVPVGKLRRWLLL